MSRAAQERVPAYVVFTDLTLQAIAEVQPADPQALLRINGIGASKLTKYGDEVFAVVAGEEVLHGEAAPTLDEALDEAPDAG